MDISFDIKRKNKSNDVIKDQVNYFKLHIEKSDRYIFDFDFYPEDNIFMCYTDDYEIEITYENNTIIKIDCYHQDEITNDLNKIIDINKNISEILLLINEYFMIQDQEENDSSSDEKEKETKTKLKQVFNQSDDELDELLSENDSDSNSTISTLSIKSTKSSKVIKDVKPVKFEFDIQPITLVSTIFDDIIIEENTETDNFVSLDIINNSLKHGKQSTVYQIVNEINKVIKNTKNIIIKPINNVFEITVENKFKDYTFEYVFKITENYPYYPPKINIKSNFNQSVTYALNNCEILNTTKWNPSTTLKDIVVGIYNNLEKHDYNTLKGTIKDKEFYELSIKLLEQTNTEPLNVKIFNFNFDFLKIQDKSNSKGIGYTGVTWDINAYQKEQSLKFNCLTDLINKIIPLIKNNKNEIYDTCIIPYIKQYIYDVSLFELDKKKEYYTSLFKLFNEIYILDMYNEHFNIEKISAQKDSFTDYPEIYKNIPVYKAPVKEKNTNMNYVQIMKELSFNGSDIIGSKKFKFMDKTTTNFTAPDYSRRLKAELKNLSMNLPVSDTSSIFLRFDESNMGIMKFLIIPHPDTPYAYGCFEFDMYLPYDYPNSPPHVEIITTGGGKFRFNPNLYDSGKVCLSLLGTWSGSGGESWTKESTILQVLLSIQSLIFCEEPYFNEPGYERDRDTLKGKESNNKYNEPVRYHTLKLGMVQQLQYPSHGFEDVIKNHFKLKQNDIYKKLDEWKMNSSNSSTFDIQINLLKSLINKL
jgi:ubiquitin-protein ligase